MVAFDNCDERRFCVCIYAPVRVHEFVIFTEVYPYHERLFIIPYKSTILQLSSLLNAWFTMRSSNAS